MPEAELPAPRARASGVRTVLAVPLLRQGAAIGAITCAGGRCAPSPTARSPCVETFADQAVIAIENARLFAELQERNRDAHGGAGAADGDGRGPAR